MASSSRSLRPLRALTLALTLALAPAVYALPLSLTEADFANQTSGLPQVLEDFNGFATSGWTPSLILSNSVYVGRPSTGQPPWCVLSRCLTTNIAPGSFEAFPPETAYWSARINPVSSSQSILITVTGRSGIAEFESPPQPWTGEGRFVGFHDPRGLLSVAFRQVPETTNYSLDDVLVAIAQPPPQAVPTLSSSGMLWLALMTLGVGWLAARRH